MEATIDKCNLQTCYRISTKNTTLEAVFEALLNSWDELQNYRKDGRYTIDNLRAERAIRPFTVSRKNSLHYSSEEGVEMAMIYLTVIETAKMWGLQIKEYLAYVWREIMSGNNKYEELTPEVVIARRNG